MTNNSLIFFLYLFIYIYFIYFCVCGNLQAEMESSLVSL